MSGSIEHFFYGGQQTITWPAEKEGSSKNKQLISGLLRELEDHLLDDGRRIFVLRTDIDKMIWFLARPREAKLGGSQSQ